MGVLTGLHLLILTLGAAWLARSVGVETAAREGVLPFLIGAVVKSALVTAVLAARERVSPRA